MHLNIKLSKYYILIIYYFILIARHTGRKFLARYSVRRSVTRLVVPCLFAFVEKMGRFSEKKLFYK